MIGETVRIGDEVLITIPPENREWGYDPCPDGTRATVLSFSEIHWGRINNCGIEPGVHINPCWARVRSADGKEWTENTGRFTLPDAEEYQRRIDEWRAAGDWRARKTKLRDLPETPFWEGDVVSAAREGYGKMFVVGIEYAWGDEPTYRISDRMNAGWHTYARAAELTLIERGNVWNYYHDLPLKFDSLTAEAEFFNMLGHTEEVRNPANDLFLWTKDEALKAIEAGLVHGFSMGGGLFGSGPHINAIRFRDEDLGRRVAAETLVGFGVPA